ncbi:MAG TPA: hypothetical protein VJ785_06775 [Anaerolineales bacterium]|nr:hypothetical protein [Anaerolineales bacterium]
MKQKSISLFLVMIGLIVISSACGSEPVPTTPIPPITIGEDLTAIDLCQAIPREDIEVFLGDKLIEDPVQYEFKSAEGTSGCFFQGPATDYTKEKHYAYIILTPVDVFDNQPLFQNKNVSGIGDAAYFNRGTDTRQLWVKIEDKVAFVVAFGDVPDEEAAKAIAKLMVEAIQ